MMVTCPGCGKQISDGLEVCVYCYRPRDQKAAAAPRARAHAVAAAPAAQPAPSILKPCRTCGREVSPLAKACPQCGAPSPLAPPAVMALGKIGSTLTLYVTVPVIVLALFAVCVAR